MQDPSMNWHKASCDLDCFFWQRGLTAPRWRPPSLKAHPWGEVLLAALPRKIKSSPGPKPAPWQTSGREGEDENPEWCGQPVGSVGGLRTDHTEPL